MATVRKSPRAAPKSEARDTAAPQAAEIPPDRIAARAYEIWQASGRPHGRDRDHWFQAERELRVSRGPGTTRR